MINEKEFFDILYSKYQKLFLNKEEISFELGISQSTLNRKIKSQEALPTFERGRKIFIFSFRFSKIYYGLK